MTTNTIHRKIVPALFGAALLGFGAGGAAMAATNGPAATPAAHPATTVSQDQMPTKEYCKKHPADPECKGQK